MSKLFGEIGFSKKSVCNLSPKSYNFANRHHISKCYQISLLTLFISFHFTQIQQHQKKTSKTIMDSKYTIQGRQEGGPAGPAPPDQNRGASINVGPLPQN